MGFKPKNSKGGYVKGTSKRCPYDDPLTCAAGELKCTGSGDCVDPNTDSAHCGTKCQCASCKSCTGAGQCVCPLRLAQAAPPQAKRCAAAPV